MDLVERQKVVDALLGITAMRNTIPLDSAIFNIKKLPSAQPEPQWIPCSERLPESTHECSGTDFDGELFYWKESDWVLAQRSTGEMVVAEYTIGDRGGYWETMDNHDINVLAWMPLPEAWRGEKQ